MISVIIPTRNRADLLAAALDSLTRQTLVTSEFEILIVDNGSTDNTAQVICQYQDRLSNLNSIYAEEPGLHIGRHAGMKAARGEFLVFADDDIEAFPTWLSAIKESFADESVAMVGGNNLPMFLEPPPAWLKSMWQRTDRRGDHVVAALSIIEFRQPVKEMLPYLIWGCNFAIRKAVLLAAGGFHPDGMPKELIRFRGDGETHVSRYVIESGLKCVFNAGASVYHKVTPERMTFKYFRQRGFNQGVSDSYTALRNQELGILSVKQSLLNRVASLGLRNARALLRHPFERKALALMAIGHKEGFEFHQLMYHTTPELRAWVHQLKYY